MTDSATFVHRRLAWAAALMIALLPAMPAAAATISGFVRAAESGEALPEVNVQLPDLHRGARTNQSGYYVLADVPAGSQRLLFSAMGYKPETRTVEVTAAKPAVVTVEMALAPHQLEEVEVRPARTLTGVETSTMRLETTQLTQLTAVAEPDLFRAVQSLPGVSSLSDFSAGLYVRGGSADQNLILLDDVDVYNPSHLFGFFSTFNVDAVKNVDLQKAGFPAQYGGRLSSLLDVHDRDGNRKRFAGVANLGVIATSATLEGPWKHGSWMLSGRQTHLEQLARAVKLDLPYGFYDVQTRVNYDPTPSDRASLSYYAGRDKLTWNKPGLDLGLNWGNTTWSGQWTHVFGPRLFSHSVLGHSGFDSNTDVVLRDFGYHAHNSIEDLSFKQALEWTPTAAHKLDAGVEAKSLHFGYHTDLGNAAPLEFSYRGVYASAYAQDAWRVTDAWNVQGGLRLDHYSEGGYWRLDPRVSVERVFSDVARAHATYGRYHQFLNLVSQEGLSFADMWFPVDGTLAPGQADHYILGTDLGPWHSLQLSVEGYYKPYRNVVEYSAEFQRSLQSPGATMGQLFNSGTGRAWGADVYLRDRWRGWDGWLGCSYGVTERTIGGYNSGLTYNPPYDRRNQVVIAQGRPLGKRWRSSFTFHYGSGQPFSLPVARYSVVDITGNTYDTPLDGTAGNGRLPAYHRLDLSLSARYHVRSWTVEPELQVVNVYNHKNVYIRTYDTDKNPAVFNDITMLPLLPTVAVKVEF